MSGFPVFPFSSQFHCDLPRFHNAAGNAPISFGPAKPKAAVFARA